MSNSAKPLSLSELQGLLPRLQATVELLGGTRTGKATAISSPKRIASRRATRGKNDPAAAEQLRARIVEYLKASKKGAASGDIAAALKEDVEAVRYGLNVLRTVKKARMTGDRSRALWHVS